MKIIRLILKIMILKILIKVIIKILIVIILILKILIKIMIIIIILKVKMVMIQELEIIVDSVIIDPNYSNSNNNMIVKLANFLLDSKIVSIIIIEWNLDILSLLTTMKIVKLRAKLEIHLQFDIIFTKFYILIFIYF